MDESYAKDMLDIHLLYQALSSFPQPACIINAEGHLMFANRACQVELFHAGQQCISELFPDQSNQVKRCVQHVLRFQTSCQDELISFQQKRYAVSFQPLSTEENDQYVMITFQLIHTPNENDIMAERNDFIQIAAHELRTPLTVIKGFIQLVLERYKEREKKWFFQPTITLMNEIERDQTFFKVINDEALRLDQLTNELLSIFKIDQGKFEMNFQRADFIQVVKEAIEEFVIPTESHVIHFSLLQEQVPVKADITQIKRVVSNLLSNAVKYSPDAYDIYVYMKKSKSSIKLYVKDEGIGIPKEQQKRIFERFFRAHSPTHDKIQGYGVGLHICREIITHHSGTIGFSSTYQQGSTFYIELPIVQ